MIFHTVISIIFYLFASLEKMISWTLFSVVSLVLLNNEGFKYNSHFLFSLPCDKLSHLRFQTQRKGVVLIKKVPCFLPM